ncbi:MAG: universal stress protein, partial [Rivularia sp. ALOHA_DT_140]|nr:universal stress protein [Rivularia sp. ALOHA_DT_140]
GSLKLLAAVDTSPFATRVLTKAAEIARRTDGEVIVLHIIQGNKSEEVEILQSKSQRILADIRHKFITISGSIPEEIIKVSQDYQVADIVMGKRGHQPWEEVLVGSVSQAVLESSSIPIILVN